MHDGRPEPTSEIVDAFTVDVEDWFHILDVEGTPPLDAWWTLPSRVEDNVERMFHLLDEHGVRATCFFLGWIAERYPNLVRAALQAGHEIASHGYAHELVFKQTEAAFFEDVRRAKALLEDLTGHPVLGYRAPGFSIVKETPWALERLAAAGFRYDASIFPAARVHGGMPDAPLWPSRVETRSGPIVEFPTSIARIGGYRICLFGGGYLRVFPYRLISAMTRRAHSEGRSIVFYVHPREIDTAQPRLPMRWRRRFKSYVNIHGTDTKLRRLFSEFAFRPLCEFLDAEGRLVVPPSRTPLAS
ncbi:MAG TPA: XrtA system polysaccharide deacetylase [Candidatus Eisenbacteria bacterium]|nr:XrtA system polysaccharide deacetylase [Candidatus Eisenbacteria bacterium]